MYADINRRITSIYLEYAPEIEEYSIDESFLFFDKCNWSIKDFEEIGYELKQRIYKVGVYRRLSVEDGEDEINNSIGNQKKIADDYVLHTPFLHIEKYYANSKIKGLAITHLHPVAEKVPLINDMATRLSYPVKIVADGDVVEIKNGEATGL